MRYLAGKKENLIGRKFNHLTVIGEAENRPYKNGHAGSVMWKCRCDCGNIVTVCPQSLKSGNTKACGCMSRLPLEKRTTHNLSRTRNYRIWQAMKARCNNPNNTYYQNYGGRGISLCDEWKNDYLAFHIWSMSHGYNDELTIDRIDNDKGYSPDNCQWVTRTVQMSNTRMNHYIEFNGITLTTSQWAEKVGLPRSAMFGRLKRGWSVQKILTTPIMARGRRVWN